MILTPWSDTTEDQLDMDQVQLSFPHGQARVSTNALLNGGNYFADAGFYHSDRQATLSGRIDKDQADTLCAWIESRTDLYFSDDFGTYKCRIRAMDLTNGVLQATLDITEKLVLYSEFVYPSPPAGAEWVTRIDNTRWTSPQMSWSGSAWTYNSDTPSLYLIESGTWVEGFEPTQARITYTSSISPEYIKIFVGEEDAYLNDGSITSGVAFPLDDSKYTISDIGGIIFSFDPFDTYTLSVSNIEFYGIS